MSSILLRLRAKAEEEEEDEGGVNQSVNRVVNLSTGSEAGVDVDAEKVDDKFGEGSNLIVDQRHSFALSSTLRHLRSSAKEESFYDHQEMTDSVVRSDASSSSTPSSSPPSPPSTTPISALPYTAWRHIISQLPIRDVMSLYHSVPEENDDFNGTLFHAIEDPSLWKKLRFIARKAAPRVKHPDPLHGDLILEDSLDATSDERVGIVVGGPINRFVSHVDTFEMYILKRHMEARIPFASLVDSIDRKNIKSVKICLEEIFEKSDLDRLADFLRGLTHNCREIVVSRWPATRWRCEGKYVSVSLTKALLDNAETLKENMEHLALGWFDYEDREFWNIGHSRHHIAKFSWMWTGNELCRERNLVDLVAAFPNITTLSIGGFLSMEPFVDTLLAADRHPLKRLQLLVNPFNVIHFATEDQKRRFRDKWAAAMQRHPDLFVSVCVADEVCFVQFESIFLPQTFPVHELVFLPFVELPTNLLGSVERRFAECLVKLSLHWEGKQEEEEEAEGKNNNINNNNNNKNNSNQNLDDNNNQLRPRSTVDEALEDAVLTLVQGCRRLTRFTAAFRFHRDFASRLMSLKGSRWRELILFKDKLFEKSQTKDLERDGSRVLRRRWRLNEAETRTEGPKYYVG